MPIVRLYVWVLNFGGSRTSSLGRFNTLPFGPLMNGDGWMAAEVSAYDL